MTPLSPPERLAASGYFERSKAQGCLPLKKACVEIGILIVLLMSLQHWPYAKQKEALVPRFRFENELGIMEIGMIDAEIIVVQIGLAGIGAWKYGRLVILIEIFEVEAPKRLKITSGSRRSGAKFGELVLQFIFEPVQELIYDRRESSAASLVSSLPNLACSFQPGIGAGSLERRVHQAQPGKFIQGRITPAVKRKGCRRRCGQGRLGKDQNSQE